MAFVIVSVGTSLLTNSGWKRGQQVPSLQAAEKYLTQENTKEASAETNTTRMLPLNQGDFIKLLHSDTPEGKWCAEALQRFYTSLHYSCELLSIEKLNYQTKNFSEGGLKSLLQVTFKAIRQAKDRNQEIKICATGGFKAEIAFLNLIGLLMGIPVYYIHESFKELIRFPSLPIDWNMQIVEENYNFFLWIDAKPRSQIEVGSWLKAIPALEPLVISDNDGFTYLSAAGDLIFKSFRAKRGLSSIEWPPDSNVTPDQKVHLENAAHHRPDEYLQFIDALAREEYVSSIRFFGKCSKQRGKTQIRINDSDEGILEIVFRKGDIALPLLVETTATGKEQTQMIIDNLKKRKLIED